MFEKKEVELLEKIEKNTGKMTELWHNLLRGIFYGFGFFVGSAIFAAIVISILSKYIAQEWTNNILDMIQK